MSVTAPLYLLLEKTEEGSSFAEEGSEEQPTTTTKTPVTKPVINSKTALQLKPKMYSVSLFISIAIYRSFTIDCTKDYMDRVPESVYMVRH